MGEECIKSMKSHTQKWRGVYQIDEITYAKGGLLLMAECRELRILKPKL